MTDDVHRPSPRHHQNTALSHATTTPQYYTQAQHSSTTTTTMTMTTTTTINENNYENNGHIPTTSANCKRCYRLTANRQRTTPMLRTLLLSCYCFLLAFAVLPLHTPFSVASFKLTASSGTGCYSEDPLF